MVAGILACALLGSCNGGAEPTVSPQETQSPQNETPTDDYTIPPRPDVDPVIEPELSGDPAADALSVALYFAQLYPYIYKTGDTTQWDAYSAPECEYCWQSSEEVQNLTANGGWAEQSLEPHEYTIGIIDETANIYEIQLLVTRSEVVVYDVTGQTTYEEGEFHLVFKVMPSEEGYPQWQVLSFQIGDPSGFTRE